MVKINKIKHTSTIFLAIILTIALTAGAFAYSISYSWNELKSYDVTDALAYSWGYDEGYDDYSSGKASQPLNTYNKWKRVYNNDPDYLGSELAYKEKASYVKGYRDGYSDAKSGNTRGVSEDFLDHYKKYGITVVEDKKTTSSETEVYGKWNLDELDTSQGIENFAYEIGYNDAEKGNSKSPLKLMNDLAKSEYTNVREIFEWIRSNRGEYIKKYKEGYEYYLGQTTSTVKSGISIRGEESEQPSQESGEEQAEAAYDLGYKLGYATAIEREASSPHQIDNYEWVLDSRYTDLETESTDRYWYTLPTIAGIKLTRTDIEIFYADKTSYLKGYREGYSIGEMQLDGQQEELSDEDYVFQLGCTIAEEGDNPFTYNWMQRRYATTTTDLDMVKLVRKHRAQLLKGYRACK